MNRRGVSLVEMLMALAIGGLLLGLAVRVDLAFAKFMRGQLERAGAVANLRAAVAVLRGELQALGADSASGEDLGGVGAARVAYRAHRGLALVCGLRPDTMVVALAALGQWRLRLPDPGRDSLLVLASAPFPAPGGWVPLGPVGGVAAVCPDGRPGQAYGTGFDSAALAGLGLAAPTIARVFESGALTGYGSAGTWQVGFEAVSAGAPVQPAVGPIDGAAGFLPALWDRDGMPLAVSGGASGVDFRIRALARRELAAGPGLASPAVESLLVTVRFGGRP